jgi:hypothetical protein
MDEANTIHDNVLHSEALIEESTSYSRTTFSGPATIETLSDGINRLHQLEGPDSSFRMSLHRPRKRYTDDQPPSMRLFNIDQVVAK